jgi:two-component system chemotaxis response regulator CheB
LGVESRTPSFDAGSLRSPGTRVICVGASGGLGLRDLQALLAALSPDLDAAVLVTLHRPVDVPSELRSVLERASRMPVRIAADGEGLRPGHCYIGEPAGHVTLGSGGRIALISDPENDYRNRTIDTLFASAAEHAGALGAGVVLSGSLHDGSEGLAAIKAAGGLALAGAPDADFSGDMPRNAESYAGPLDGVAAPEDLARMLEAWAAPNALAAA